MSSGKHAVHGGAFFDAIGVDFSTLDRKSEVINADVLDAWYDPSPRVIAAIQEHLPWLIKTSPPTHGEGLRSVIAEVRHIPEQQVLLGGGSSQLMYLAFPHLVKPGSRVTLLDPMYGEYEHIFRHVLGCEISYCELLSAEDFRPDMDRLIQASQGSDLVVLVNPNSPTGVHISKSFVQELLSKLTISTKLWIDETYIDYVPGESVEDLVEHDSRLIVSKSMSKIYALSGLRVGYLVADRSFVSQLAPLSPPWSVGLIAQLAGVEALRDAEYYAARIAETNGYRESLASQLSTLPDVRVIPAVANYMLVELDQPVAEQVVQRCAANNVFLRNCDSLSPRFRGHYIRVAVKTPNENSAIVKALAAALE